MYRQTFEGLFQILIYVSPFFLFFLSLFSDLYYLSHECYCCSRHEYNRMTLMKICGYLVDRIDQREAWRIRLT